MRSTSSTGISVNLIVIGGLIGRGPSQFNTVVSQHALDDDAAAVACKLTMVGPSQLDAAKSFVSLSRSLGRT